MALMDHFHPPLKSYRPWEGFHAEWGGAISRQLNVKLLSERYVAIQRIHFGGRIEIDAATVEELGEVSGAGSALSGGGTATAVWAPARPTLAATIDFLDLDVIEIQVFDEDSGQRLVAAVELVSPANKDRLTTREMFAAKCAGYLQEGVSLLVVDIVTNRSANLHRELLELLKLSDEIAKRAFPELYAVAYRTVPGSEKGQLQAWEAALALGNPLPVLPLWIGAEKAVPLDLQSSYAEACALLRIRT